MLHGDADRAVRPPILRGYEPYADDLSVELLPGCGHFVCDSDPDGVAKRIVAFAGEQRAGIYTEARTKS